MKATNQTLPSRSAAPLTLSSYLNREIVVKELQKQVGGDAQKAARLIATIKRVVSKSSRLQECEYGSIISTVVYGEIALDLSEEFGEYSVVPYGTNASFQIGAKGLQQLAIRSGAYSAIDCYDVRQGEYIGRDPRTRAPIFKWIEDEDERDKLPIVGYYAFFMLNESCNNYFQSIYWPHAKILRHADKYSKAFDLKTYNALIAGELSDGEMRKKQAGSPWYALPDEEPHIKMCKKTVFKQLLSDGRAPKSIQRALAIDNAQERDGNAVIYDTGLVLPSTSISSTALETDGNGEILTPAAILPSSAPESAAVPNDAVAPKNKPVEEPVSFFDNEETLI